MLSYLFLVLVVLPIVEIVILVRIGQITAWWVPVAIVIATGVAGSALVRWQGWKVFERIRDNMRDGRVPADSLIDGFLVLMAGILFVMPGVVTDLAGIALLIPPLRGRIKRRVNDWIKKRIEFRAGTIGGGFWSPSGNSTRFEHDRIIDAKVIGTRVEDDKH
jgi:UPF0716 protein FxsA